MKDFLKKLKAFCPKDEEVFQKHDGKWFSVLSVLSVLSIIFFTIHT